MYGDYKPSVILKNSVGTDITANYDEVTVQAIVSLYFINGSSIANKVGGLIKSGETLDAIDQSYFVQGTQIYEGTILQSFINDAGDVNYTAYTIDEDYQPVESSFLGGNVTDHYLLHTYGILEMPTM